MRQLPEPGEWVAWRSIEEVRRRSWDRIFGEGPFEVVAIVDHNGDGMPSGVIVLTRQGEQEISETWLVRQEAPDANPRR